jgi:hypothetical protein
MKITHHSAGIGYIPPLEKVDRDERLITIGNSRLKGMACLFYTRDDDKDDKTRVEFSVDIGEGHKLIGGGKAGEGEKWDDWSSHDCTIPLLERPTFDECNRGHFVVVIYPDGDDEWHFDVVLAMYFENEGWRRMVWQNNNLAEDRPGVSLAWV